MPDRADDIISIARSAAQERSTFAKLESFMGTKMHKWTKPANVAKTAAGVAAVFIPIPGVSVATDYIMAKTTASLRSRSNAAKKRKYDDLLQQNADPLASVKKVKFDIKDLNTKHLEESLRKVRKQIEQYNNQAASLSPCHRAFQGAYRYFRAVHRVQKLRQEAELMRIVAEEIIEYCEAQEEALEGGYDDMVARVEDCSLHGDICAAGPGCYNSPNGEQVLRRDAERVRGVELP